MSGPMGEGPLPIPMSEQEIAYHQRMMREHADAPGTGRCAKCGTEACITWHRSRMRLILAGVIGREHNL